MVERGTLLRCCIFTGTEGSNPSLSARLSIDKRLYQFNYLFPHCFPHNHSSNLSLVRGWVSSLSVGGGVAVRLWRSSSTAAASKSLIRCSPCSLASASLDAGMTVPSFMRRSNWNCLKVWVFTLPAYSVSPKPFLLIWLI